MNKLNATSILFAAASAAAFVALQGVNTSAQSSSPSNNNTNQGSGAEVSDVPQTGSERPFWQATLPGGHYMVRLGSITSISHHKYYIQGGVVTEVVIETTGDATARLYHMEASGENSPSNTVSNLTTRAKQLIEKGAARSGTEEQLYGVQKQYPLTTHARMIEYRIREREDLLSLYNSVRRAWIDGKGSKFTIKYQ